MSNTQLTPGQKHLQRIKELLADPVGQCSICDRYTWRVEDSEQPCNMPQPDGTKCKGIFKLFSE